MPNKKNLAYKKRDFLSLIAKAKNPKKRNQLIDYADNEEILAICECIYNVLQNNIPIEDKDYKKLKKFKTTLRSLIRKTSMKKRKNTLKQHGGFLNVLIPAALSVLSGLLGRR